MPPFRDNAPSRRTNPTKKPRIDWTKHKSDLKIDFNEHCAYCDSFDGFRHTFFEVDHFVPKEWINNNPSSIGLVDYENLVYSCKFCNNNKLNKWPSNSDKVYNDGKEGFVDPCDQNYDDHFYRTADGAIM